MASLTKIMTFYTALHIIKESNLDIDTQVIFVPRCAVFIGGTTAYLKEGDGLTLKDLFYALMLPSGNDAAMTLSNYLGKKVSDQVHH